MWWSRPHQRRSIPEDSSLTPDDLPLQNSHSTYAHKHSSLYLIQFNSRHTLKMTDITFGKGFAQKDIWPLCVCFWPSGSGCKKRSVWFFWERICLRSLALDGSPCAEEQHGAVVFLSSERLWRSSPHAVSLNLPHCPTPQNLLPHHHSNNRYPVKKQEQSYTRS